MARPVGQLFDGQGRGKFWREGGGANEYDRRKAAGRALDLLQKLQTGELQDPGLRHEIAAGLRHTAQTPLRTNWRGGAADVRQKTTAELDQAEKAATLAQEQAAAHSYSSAWAQAAEAAHKHLTRVRKRNEALKPDLQKLFDLERNDAKGRHAVEEMDKHLRFGTGYTSPLSEETQRAAKEYAEKVGELPALTAKYLTRPLTDARHSLRTRLLQLQPFQRFRGGASQ